MRRLRCDEFGVTIDNRTPNCLVGRIVHFDYVGNDHRHYENGTIVSHLGGMCFGVVMDGYTANGHHITVDMHRSEFTLPRA